MTSNSPARRAGSPTSIPLASTRAASRTVRRRRTEAGQGAAQDHAESGIGYGLLRHLNPRTRNALARLAEPQVAFNYLGRFASPQDADWSVAVGSDVLNAGADDAMPSRTRSASMP
ncbi:hypothetical protein NKH18_47455 [Streptomyces sp. M10(2022)]